MSNDFKHCYEMIIKKTVHRFSSKLNSVFEMWAVPLRFSKTGGKRLLLFFSVFFMQYILFQTPAYAESGKDSVGRRMDWDADSVPVRITGRAAVSYCSKKGKKLPDMNELSAEICRFRNSSGHWTSYVYEGGSRVFCVCLKSGGPVCSDQKESRKAYARCIK